MKGLIPSSLNTSICNTSLHLFSSMLSVEVLNQSLTEHKAKLIGAAKVKTQRRTSGLN